MERKMGINPYDVGLERNAANYSPLTPLRFLEWSAHVSPQRTAVIHGARRFAWRDTYARCRRLASALAARGIGVGDTVAVMLCNTPEMYECHFGVPMSGAVLNTLNIRLDAETLAFMLGHGEAKVLITDREFSPVITRALELLSLRERSAYPGSKADPSGMTEGGGMTAAGASPIQGGRRPFDRQKLLVIDVDDPEYAGPGERVGGLDYEELLATGDPDYAWSPPADEWDAIALNYTSGTTGNPKGVVFHHRGAYLNAIGNILTWSLPRRPVYLWTVPMFHCNGWCFPWSLAAVSGTNVCLRKVDAAAIFRLIREHRVTHYCGAPIVHNTMLLATDETREGITHRVQGMVAGAAPPAATIEAMERIGIELTHVYGLTEVYGPATVCLKQEEWEQLEPLERAALNSRQGVRYVLEDAVMVLDPETMLPVPWDGETIGEIMFRGSITMKGYLKNPAATTEAFAGGWFHSGDLAVMHPDGYFKIKDRSKDIIISGGENISSIEVEDVLHRHPAVFAAAVVAQPDEKWGETPCAFVELKPDCEATEEELIAYCRDNLAHFKAPKSVVFGPLPKTSTGKIQKYMLRERVRSASAISDA